MSRILILLLLLTPQLRAQDTPAPASQPTTSQPTTQQANELRSPQSMVAFFLKTVKADQELTPEELIDALRCLDPAAVDPERWAQDKATYVVQLAEILRALQQRAIFNPEELPEDPAHEPNPVIGQADLIALTLQRIEVEDAGETRLNWVFNAATVGRLPELHARLGDLDRDQEPETPQVPQAPREDLDRLRTPPKMLSYFLNQQVAAETDPSAYETAMACIDFGNLLQDRSAEGPRKVDELARVLQYLIDEEGRKIDQVQAAEGKKLATIGSDKFRALQIELVQQPDGAWLFSTETMRSIDTWAEQVGDLTSSIPLDTSSPRATMNLFLQAMGRQQLDVAVTCFDTQGLTNTDSAVLYNLAGKLWLVLNRHQAYTIVDFPKKLEANRFELLTHSAGRVELVRISEEGEPDRWLFPPTTIRVIDALYAAYASKPILSDLKGRRISFWALPGLYVREYLVPPTYKKRWYGLEIWQWLGIVFSLASALLAYFVTARIAPPLVRQLLSTRDAVILPTTVRRSLRPLFFLAAVGAMSLGLRLLDFEAEVLNWVLWTLRMVATVFGVWAAYQIIDLGTAFFSVVAARTKSRLDDVLVPLLQKTLKVVAAAIGGIVIANAFGFNVGPLLAGLGVGGLAFGLAAQDTLKNFFGSVNVVLDRPFQVGDWVRVGDTEGTIEAVGLRSTRIRTFYNSEITVPNSNLMTTAIDNMGRRRYRRISMQVGVQYNTSPAQLDAFCEGIRELIRQHPYTRKDYFHVYVNSFGDSAINILLYCFHECPDWGVELRERHRLLLDIMRLANRLGVEFAFPTQTVHLHHDSSPDSLPPDTPAIPKERSEAEVFGRDTAGSVVKEFPPSADEIPKR